MNFQTNVTAIIVSKILPNARSPPLSGYLGATFLLWNLAPPAEEEKNL